MKRKIHREDIVKTGLDLMFLNGYHHTGVKEITDSIDIPKGSFYNHFSSKEEFGLAVLQHYCDNGVQFHEKGLLQSKESPLTRMKAFYKGMIKGYVKDLDFKLGCVMGNFSQELGDTNERFRQVLDDEFNKCEHIIVQCLNEAKQSKEIDNNIDTKSMGAFILNSWHGALVRMKSTANGKPLDDFYNLIFTQILV
ncbi:TetR family transcriptional regulator C-terminal domain-containing protein [Flavobacteriaceae bacterium S356]|uniref:TetR family transcriptional regulator C-terminal domain-containing protein n=1 Tax=Asprobacillus argus TaxID=3076534 RepID=A0ABU3LFI6_9FLAO|nr:TetR family transcriptional regulator C-terminal domain-containing protein [Flavobacteriaceae bacterium S356]